jgi:hypothetical protein
VRPCCPVLVDGCLIALEVDEECLGAAHGSGPGCPGGIVG